MDCALSPGHGDDAYVACIADAITLVFRWFAAVLLQDKQESTLRNASQLLHAFFRGHDSTVLHHFPVPCVAPGEVLAASAIGKALLHKRLAIHLLIGSAEVSETHISQFIAVYHLLTAQHGIDLVSDRLSTGFIDCARLGDGFQQFH